MILHSKKEKKKKAHVVLLAAAICVNLYSACNLSHLDKLFLDYTSIYLSQMSLKCTVNANMEVSAWWNNFLVGNILSGFDL